MLWLCIPLPLLLALLSLDWDIRFEKDRMAHNTFWGFGAEEYPYSDIIDIQHHLSTTTPIGVITDFPHNEIHFKDGYIYTMDECFMDVVDEDTELELITYVSEQSGIPISTIAQGELAP